MAQHKAATYVRDLSLTADKFLEFDRLCREARDLGIETLIVATPQVLGDNYAELVTNLEKLAAAGLLLAIVPSASKGLN